ncbi:unnamed protein product [Symbiodinium natans]|uniref:Uncharacterized protein n=1 Tax=Symbiodinium natans TaxID=878477 RepID=A0A812LDN5_9DINO|nr:unnamed protein product [Symbiodinium natans]
MAILAFVLFTSACAYRQDAMPMNELELDHAQLIESTQGLLHTIKDLRFQYQGLKANASFAELDDGLAHFSRDGALLQTVHDECKQHVHDLKVYLGQEKEEDVGNFCRLHREKGSLITCDSKQDCIYGCSGGGGPGGRCTCEGIMIQTCGCRKKS